MQTLDTKYVVDSFYSIGKIHTHQTIKELEKLGRDRDIKVNPNIGIMVPFMHYLINDMLRELKVRLPEMSPIQIAYICKGITNLKKLLNQNNMKEEKEYLLVILGLLVAILKELEEIVMD